MLHSYMWLFQSPLLATASLSKVTHVLQAGQLASWPWRVLQCPHQMCCNPALIFVEEGGQLVISDLIQRRTHSMASGEHLDLGTGPRTLSPDLGQEIQTLASPSDLPHLRRLAERCVAATRIARLQHVEHPPPAQEGRRQRRRRCVKRQRR